MRTRTTVLFALLLATIAPHAEAHEVWITPTYQGDVGGVGVSNSGVWPLTKIGAGTQTLTGANTYSNATTVSGGKLVFGAPGSLPASAGAITVNSNATLDVAAVSPVTLISSSSFLAPPSTRQQSS